MLETATGALTAVERVKHQGSKRTQDTCSRISVHVPSADANTAQRRLARMLATARERRAFATAELEEKDVRDEAWASSWKKYYKPFIVAPRLYIAPSWEREFKPPRGGAVLWMDPGMAFGTGLHPTTQLALRLMLRRIRSGSVVLDIGCGSGVLGLAAAQRGARVYASDTDAIAVGATRENFAANRLAAAAILRARGVPSSFPRAQLIVANITARVLTGLGRSLARQLRSGGTLITCGVVESGRAAVLDTMRRNGLELVEERTAGEWYAHVHRKPKRS